MEHHHALPQATFFRTRKFMEIHFALETEKKLKDLAAQSGRKTADELVQDVIEGYFEELAQTRTLLNSRYDDLKSGRVKPIPGDHFRVVETLTLGLEELDVLWLRKDPPVDAAYLHATHLVEASAARSPLRRPVLTSTRFGNSFARIYDNGPIGSQRFLKKAHGGTIEGGAKGDVASDEIWSLTQTVKIDP